MTVEEAHKWLDGTYDEQTYFNSLLDSNGGVSYSDKTQFTVSLSAGVAQKMKQAIYVLQYQEVLKFNMGNV